MFSGRQLSCGSLSILHYDGSVQYGVAPMTSNVTEYLSGDIYSLDINNAIQTLTLGIETTRDFRDSNSRVPFVPETEENILNVDIFNSQKKVYSFFLFLCS